MSSPATRYPAECDHCGHRFEVPDPTKAYQCKACGVGRVTADPASCPECGSEVGHDDAFCETCGASLQPAGQAREDVLETLARSRKKAPPKSGRSKSRNKAIKGQLNKALKSVRTLRMFFTINAALELFGLAMIVLVFALPGFDTTVSILALMIQSLVVAVMLGGVFLVMHQPAIWSVVMACLVTLSRTVKAYEEDWNMIWVGIGVVWAAAFWSLVGPAGRANRILDDNPDLAYAKKLAGSRAAAKRKAIVSGGLSFGAASFLALFFHYGGQAKPLDPVWEAFVEDWEADRGDKIRDWIAEGIGEAAATEFEAEARERGWMTDLPDLPPHVKEMAEDFRLPSVEDPSSGEEHLICETEEGVFEFFFRYRITEKTWILYKVIYPMAEFPLALKLRLENAWETDDLDGIINCYKDPSSAGRKVRRWFEHRGLEEDLPDAEAFEVRASSDRYILYVRTKDYGVFRFFFERVDGEYVIQSMRGGQKQE